MMQDRSRITDGTVIDLAAEWMTGPANIDVYDVGLAADHHNDR